MVFGFMKQSGGHITVYSEPGKGTTFRLYLPRLRRHGDRAGGAVGPSRPSRGGSETILVVEDNAGLRRIVVRQLGEAGYRVLQAPDADGGDAIDRSRRADPPAAHRYRDAWRDGRSRPRARRGGAAATAAGPADLGLSRCAIRRLGSRTGSRLLSKPYRKEELRRGRCDRGAGTSATIGRRGLPA